jgi:hypothetical protein
MSNLRPSREVRLIQTSNWHKNGRPKVSYRYTNTVRKSQSSFCTEPKSVRDKKT